ncbi:MAG: hypothetical protein RLZZ522_2030 [Verrucomicrobiota bacterium]
MTKTLPTVIWLGCLLGASAGQQASISTAPPAQKLPDIDAVFGLYTYSDEMDFDKLNGGLSVSEFDLFSALSKPITVAGDVLLVPAFQYGYTDLDVGGVNNAFPIQDEELHSMALHLAAVKMNSGSPWFYGGWVRAELATDFQHVNGDDFTFDVAAGVGYRYNHGLTVAAGVAALNFNGAFWVCPGINFDWVVNETTRIGLYGPMPVISYTPNDDWSFTLRGFPGGGIWSIDDRAGDSKAIDLTSYQVGAFVGRKLVDKLWLNAGVGMTSFNSIELTDPDGDNAIIDADMDWAPFYQIGLSLRAW